MPFISHGRSRRTVRRTRMVLHLTARNISRWTCSSPPVAGVMARISTNIPHGDARILRYCVHKGGDRYDGEPMWNPDNKLIKFIPETEWSDPSYPSAALL